MKLSPEQMLEWTLTAFPELPSEIRAQFLTFLKEPPRGTTRSEVMSGLKQGMNDALAMAKDRSLDERHIIDAALAAKGLPSLRKMDAVLKKKHQRILARGSIRNAEEFYIVAEILSDLDFDISESDRSKLGKISHAYETSKK